MATVASEFELQADQVSYVLVLKVAEHLQFSVDSSARHEVLEDVRHLFQGFTGAISWINN